MFVDTLRFGLAAFSHDNDWRATLDVVLDAAQASRIKDLRFDAYRYEDSEISWTPFGDFTGAWARLPALEVLHIRSGKGGTLGTLDLPKLRTFVRESGGLRASEIEAICHARWPALEHLAVWFGSPNYGAEGTVDAIRASRITQALPQVTSSGQRDYERPDPDDDDPEYDDRYPAVGE